MAVGERPGEDGRRGAVVVTGASSGIGEACVRRLAGLGFHVIAGVRKVEDGERLRGEIPGVTPLVLDVTDAASIAAAAQAVRDATGDRGLAGLVNNAGIAVPAPVEHQPIDDFRHQIEVNLIGQVAVTQAFLPELRAARGRIVNMSSIGGKVAVPLLGAYAASKFGLEGFSDTLRRELRPWGVHVAVIEPGTIATPIWDKGIASGDELEATLSGQAKRDYGPLIATVRTASEQGAKTGLPPDAVAKDVAHALTARRPRTRYLVGREAKSRALLARIAGDRIVDNAVARVMRWG
ncbi:MAG: SDR family NAD(P)-dependent oxidoreductase [Actinobacteria bacterium]|nr:SDR family NAD(P)-dependent oxidoreductase [Actinomycetota bacterium]